MAQYKKMWYVNYGTHSVKLVSVWNETTDKPHFSYDDKSWWWMPPELFKKFFYEDTRPSYNAAVKLHNQHLMDVIDYHEKAFKTALKTFQRNCLGER